MLDTTLKNTRTSLIAATAALLMVLSTACSKSGGSSSMGSLDPQDNGAITKPGTGDDEITLPEPGYKMEPLVWTSSKYPERDQWAQYIMKLALNDFNTLLQGAEDMNKFCPNYDRLDNNQRANVWAQLIAAMTKFESNHNPLARMHETTMGTDPVTGGPVYSEGLLQLSYQDTRGWKHCDFDWEADKKLSATSPKKTILNPYRNLYCGVGILAKMVAKNGTIILGPGAYWSVIKSNSQYQKIDQITGMVKSLSICK